jgi:hypothetical protein
VTRRSTGLTALQRKPVTFYGTRSRPARPPGRSYGALVPDGRPGPGRWQREWKLYSSVLLGWLLNGAEVPAAELYAAALVMRLARWEYGEEQGVHDRRRRTVVLAAVPR